MSLEPIKAKKLGKTEKRKVQSVSGKARLEEVIFREKTLSEFEEALKEKEAELKQAGKKLEKKKEKLQEIIQVPDVEILGTVIANKGDLEKTSQQLFQTSSPETQARILQTLQKPYVASDLSQALEKYGVTINTIAQVLSEHIEARGVELVPYLVPLEIDGAPVMREIKQPDGSVQVVPEMTMLKRKNPNTGRVETVMVARELPSKSNQWAVDTLIRWLIQDSSGNEESQGSKTLNFNTINFMSDILKEQPELLEQLKKSLNEKYS